MTNDKLEVVFKRTLRNAGNTTGVSLPQELVDFLGAQRGDVLAMAARVGKQGKGICIWIDEKIDEVK